MLSFISAEAIRIISLILAMALSGMLGCYCRAVLDRTYKNINFVEIIIPGIVAAFIVPLFLSIGRSEIVQAAIKSEEDFFQNMFIIVAFCLLAGVSAHNFVDALARDALRTATRAEQKADKAAAEITQTKDIVAETKDIVAEEVEPQNSSAPVVGENQTLLAHLTGAEQSLVEVFLAHPNKARVLSSLAREMGISEGQTYVALKNLIGKKIVRAFKSERTGSNLYRLTSEAD